jgi:glycogen synthase
MMMEILAEEFVTLGHQVCVVTQTSSDVVDDQKYKIVRSPTLRSYLQILRWADVCLFANVSLRGLWPMTIVPKPLVISHGGVYGLPAGQLSLVAEIKRAFTRFATNVCCSEDVKLKIPGKSVVIPNTFRNEIFRIYGDVMRDTDIVFVGRFVSDKGIADLIDALRHLGEMGFQPRLSLIGDGPELPAILTKLNEFGLRSQVTLTGIKRGVELARLIGRHRVMAVPSRWAEPFGIVALEGIACGCVIVGTNLGGLPEAIGPCGIAVPNGGVAEMAQALKFLLTDESARETYRSRASAHLARHSRSTVAHRYLEILKSVV